jgi:TctA family transporter
MDVFANLLLGFDVALTPANLLYCLIGPLIGTLIGFFPASARSRRCPCCCRSPSTSPRSRR